MYNKVINSIEFYEIQNFHNALDFFYIYYTMQKNHLTKQTERINERLRSQRSPERSGKVTEIYQGKSSF